MDDDSRRYWNPGALFAENLARYLRRPHGSRRARIMVAGGLVLVAVVVVFVVAIVVWSAFH